QGIRTPSGACGVACGGSFSFGLSLSAAITFSRSAFSVLARRSSGAGAASAAPSAAATSPNARNRLSLSHSGKSPRTCAGAAEMLSPFKAARSASVIGAGACGSSIRLCSIHSALCPNPHRSAPHTQARGVSAPMRQALDCFQRSAPKTRSPISARSFEPAKRWVSIHAFTASVAGRRSVSSEVRISIAACWRAPLRIGRTPQKSVAEASASDGLAEYEQVAVRRKYAQLALVIRLVGRTVDIAGRHLIEHRLQLVVKRLDVLHVDIVREAAISGRRAVVAAVLQQTHTSTLALNVSVVFKAKIRREAEALEERHG